MSRSVPSSPASPPDQPRSAGSLRRTPRDFVHMFTERWWIGAITGVVAAALVIWFRPHFEPIFSTEVSLLFEVRKDRVLNIQEVVDNSLQTASELNTHMEQIRSTTFANYVLASFSAAETELIQKAYLDPLHPSSPPPSLAAIIRPNLNVTNRRNTPIVSLVVSNRSPEAAALIANRYARKYIDYNLDGANTRTNSASSSSATRPRKCARRLAPRRPHCRIIAPPTISRRSASPRTSSCKRWLRSAPRW